MFGINLPLFLPQLKPMWATKKNPLTFQYANCLIGILDPYNGLWPSLNNWLLPSQSLYNPTNTVFFIASLIPRIEFAETNNCVLCLAILTGQTWSEDLGWNQVEACLQGLGFMAFEQLQLQLQQLQQQQQQQLLLLLLIIIIIIITAPNRSKSNH